MKIIAGPRGSGKTTELIELCAKTPKSIIVCASKRQAECVKHRAKSMGCDIPDPITMRQLQINRIQPYDYKTLLFDDLETILYSVVSLAFDIKAATLTGENIKQVNNNVPNSVI